MSSSPTERSTSPSNSSRDDEEALAHVDAVVAITDGAVDLTQQLAMLVDGRG